MSLNLSDLSKAQDYINKQFATRSWWPKAPPEQAKHEFTLMQHDPAALTLWCEKWLDAGQRRKLKKAINA